MSLKSALSLTKSLLTPRSSASSIPTLPQPPHKFHRAPTETSLFPPAITDPNADTCTLDCQSCTLHYPRGFKIDESEHLYGGVNGWGVHMVVATGKSDWVRDVADEGGSVMEAVRVVLDAKAKAEGGKEGEGDKEVGLMVSASNMPVPEEGGEGQTRVLLLPRWVFVERVTPARVEALMERYVDGGVNNMSLLGDGEGRVGLGRREDGEQVAAAEDIIGEKGGGDLHAPSSSNDGDGETEGLNHSGDGKGPASQNRSTRSTLPTNTNLSAPFETRPCPHNYLILLCSHRTRDARCGQSAPLLRKEFERQLRPLGLYRDLHDERPGGVGIYFINHVGGHKFSANVMVYRRAVKEDGTMGEASQCIWLARVRPEDCEPIVKYTVLQGKVVKPQRQLRGGFDREKGLVSW